MKRIALQTTEGCCIAAEVRIADSFLSRCIGLLRERELDPLHGMLLIPGATVHTLGMRFPIDVVFLDRRMRILGLAHRVLPQRVRRAPKGTARVLELAAGRIAAVGLRVGAHVLVVHDEPPAAERSSAAHSLRRARCQQRPFKFSLRLPPKYANAPRPNPACGVQRARVRKP